MRSRAAGRDPERDRGALALARYIRPQTQREIPAGTPWFNASHTRKCMRVKMMRESKISSPSGRKILLRSLRQMAPHHGPIVVWIIARERETTPGGEDKESEFDESGLKI